MSETRKLFESIQNNYIKENATEQYWDATEIKRDGFNALLKFNFGTDSHGNNYIITKDAYDIKRFYADTDEEAIKIYDKWNNATRNGFGDYTLDENLKESNEPFSGVEFEKNVPHEMRFKEYDIVNTNDLYWVTQQPFSLNQLNQFAEAFKNTKFSKAYVTVRDFSTYDFERDNARNVFAIIDKYNDIIDPTGYVEAVKKEGWEKILEESEKLDESLNLYDRCYNTDDREELKELALNGIYVADNDKEIIGETMTRMEDRADEYREELTAFAKAPYDFVANNYTNMPLDLLREIALNAIYVANNDEAVQKEIEGRINEAEEKKSNNSAEIKKWSKQFVNDIMSDPEIQELSKLPDNEYGDKAIDVGVAKNYFGNIIIYYNSWGDGGEISIAGFDESGKPYFDYDGIITYEDMLSDIKKEIKEDIKFTQDYDKKRSEKLTKAQEELSKMSQEEKDKIIISYLMNNKLTEAEETDDEKYKNYLRDVLNSGKVIIISNDDKNYTPTKFLIDNGKVYFNNKEVSFGWNEHPDMKSIEDLINHIITMEEEGCTIAAQDRTKKDTINETEKLKESRYKLDTIKYNMLKDKWKDRDDFENDLSDEEKEELKTYKELSKKLYKSTRDHKDVIDEAATDEGEEYDDFIYQLVGGDLAGMYTLDELKQLPVFTDKDSGENPGRRKELKNQPILDGYYGPMWNGVEDRKGVIRYETPEMYDMLSESEGDNIKLTKDTKDMIELGDMLVDNSNKYIIVDIIDLPKSKSITVRDAKDWKPIYSTPINKWYGTKIIKGPFTKEDVLSESEGEALDKDRDAYLKRMNRKFKTFCNNTEANPKDLDDVLSTLDELEGQFGDETGEYQELREFIYNELLNESSISFVTDIAKDNIELGSTVLGGLAKAGLVASEEREKPTKKEILKETGEWDDNDPDMAEWLEEMRRQAEELANQIGGEVKSVHGFDAYQGPYAIVHSPKYGDMALWFDQEDDRGLSFNLRIAHVGWISGGINQLAELLNKDKIEDVHIYNPNA